MEIIDGYLRVEGNSLNSFGEIKELEGSENLGFKTFLLLLL